MDPISQNFPYYSFYSKDNKIKAETDFSVRQRAQGIIYLIQHKSKDKAYIGKTTTSLAARIHTHVHCANNLICQSKLYRALRKHPNDYHYRVIQQNIPISQVGAWEKKFIKDFKPSLNTAAGGGGGISFHSLPLPKNVDASEKAKPSEKTSLLETPKKYYRIRRSANKVHFLLSPKSKRRRNVIYVFKNKVTGRRLYGKTGQPLGKRISQYKAVINSEKIHRLRNAFYKEINLNPENFVLGIIAKSSGPLSLNPLETHCAQRNIASGGVNYNLNKGGGGGNVASC